jgi:hypothetical protein
MPTAIHEARAELLRSLATLAGFAGGVGGQLPDGCRPDVLRYSTHSRTIFLGDAKDTEAPGCAATSLRLMRYLEWIASHQRFGGAAVFAICFGRRDHADAWVETILKAARQVGLDCDHVGLIELAPGSIVAWLTAHPWLPVAANCA